MALEKQSKMYKDNDRAVIYIPNAVLNDSSFPLTSTLINVRIEDGRLIIEEVK